MGYYWTENQINHSSKLMYNGVGLLSVRGSGTSGYIQTNRFNLRRSFTLKKLLLDSEIEHRSIRFSPNTDILKHEEKHKHQIRVIRLQEDLEIHDLRQDEITKKTFLRHKEMKKKAKTPNTLIQSSSDTSEETHAVAMRKFRQMEGLAKALDIDLSKISNNIREKTERYT